ncbi:HAD family hydrolase [Parachitinimonas caeni]|uniref:HAD-IB family hydrolase n=1 Tax=Parachitinimonas caeni TaxID=3031301 RepID=A0ABT7DUW9_9NEIS|nr:HAD family hydrolase [Parachitinimonas caeni]MDK2122920.1 HAD-IB family hydrolase [Parachitinimonas caeni]
MSQELALFDFDGTLTDRDSLLPFLRYVAGDVTYFRGMAILSPLLLAYLARIVPNDIAKQKVITRFLGGRDLAEVSAWGELFAEERIPNWLRPGVVDKLKWHQQAGHECVLVSASPDIYLAPFAKRMGFSAVLCTRLETQGSRLTGRLNGPNCYGPEKVRRINDWLNGRQPEVVHAYGDSRGDREMLAMAHHKHYKPR